MISKQTRLPIVLSNVPLYRPFYASTGDGYDLIYDEVVTLRHAAQCSMCGYIIAAGSVARSRGEMRGAALHRFKWCENCDVGGISNHADGRLLDDPNRESVEAELADAEQARDTGGDVHDQLAAAIAAVQGVAHAMDACHFTLAADDTLYQRAWNVRSYLKMRITKLEEELAKVKDIESDDERMHSVGILVPTEKGITTNVDSVADELEVDDETARVLVCYPQALRAILTAFWKLKRAA